MFKVFFPPFLFTFHIMSKWLSPTDYTHKLAAPQCIHYKNIKFFRKWHFHNISILPIILLPQRMPGLLGSVITKALQSSECSQQVKGILTMIWYVKNRVDCTQNIGSFDAKNNSYLNTWRWIVEASNKRHCKLDINLSNFCFDHYLWFLVVFQYYAKYMRIFSFYWQRKFSFFPHTTELESCWYLCFLDALTAKLLFAHEWIGVGTL